jgi:hypothetical protein
MKNSMQNRLVVCWNGEGGESGNSGETSSPGCENTNAPSPLQVNFERIQSVYGKCLPINLGKTYTDDAFEVGDE